MELTGGGLIQEKSYSALKFALTFDKNKVLRAEFTKGMEPKDVAAALRKLADQIERSYVPKWCRVS
jgi:hypothetical protein